MRVGEYELTQKIGAGGMGEVWLGRRAATDGFSKTVAVKFPPAHLAGDARARRSFVREVQLSMHLSHSNIVQVFDVGEAEGRLFMVMEWVDGCDVRRLLEGETTPGGGAPICVAAHITAEILRALEYAHTLRHEGAALGIVHRDVSPHNVLISTSGEVKLTDFGVARTEHEETSGMHVPGKLRYMAPEQFKGARRSPTMDLYAVGAILHELLSGRRFREAAQEGELYRLILEGHVPDVDRDDVPAPLEALRRSLLAPTPAGRPGSASEALRFLEDIESPAQARRELAVRCREITGVEAPRSGVFAALSADVEGDVDVGARASQPDTRTLARPGDARVSAEAGGDRRPGVAVSNGRTRRRFAAVAIALPIIGSGFLFVFGGRPGTVGGGDEPRVLMGAAVSGEPSTPSASPARADPPRVNEEERSRSYRRQPVDGESPSVALAGLSPQAAPSSVVAQLDPGDSTRGRTREDAPAAVAPTPAVAGVARVTFRASDYDFAYVRVNDEVMTLEPRASLDLPVGRHAVFMRLRAEEPWRRIGTVRLVRDRSYTVRLRAPGRLDLQMTATP